MNQTTIWLTSFCIIVASSSLAFAAEPRKLPHAQHPTLTQAIAALTQELKSNKLREKSDYFLPKPPTDLTPEIILQALERPIAGHPAAQAYIKWQLLSAVPGKFPEDLAKRATLVYRKAPLPAEHPGFDHKNLERQINGISKEEMNAANKEFAEIISRWNAANEPILSYRTALYDRLPTNYETLQAGLADLQERLSRGVKSDKFFDTVSAGIRSWALTAQPSQVNSIGNQLYDVKSASTAKGARPYVKIFDKDSVKRWQDEPALDPKKPDSLIDFLKSVANNQPGGLKFKDDKK